MEATKTNMIKNGLINPDHPDANTIQNVVGKNKGWYSIELSQYRYTKHGMRQ